MGRYTLVDNSIWGDDEFDELNDSGKIMYLYLLTCPVGNISGFFKLPPKQIASDLGKPKEKILPQLKAQKKLWKYDEETRQVLIPNYLKYNKASNERQVKAINAAINKLTLCELHVDFLKAFLTYSGMDAWKYLDRDLVVDILTLAEDLNTESAQYLKYTFKLPLL